MKKTQEPSSDHLISSADFAAYTVCPKAWQLKRQNKHSRRSSERAAQSQQIRREWVEDQDLYTQLKKYAKITYLLLVAIVIVVFLLEGRRLESQRNVTQLTAPSADTGTTIPFEIPFEIFLLIGVVGIVIVLWDLFDRHSVRLREKTGLEQSTEVIAVKGSSYRPGKEYLSTSSQLTGKPYALIKEDDFVIPVEINPMSKKVKDRHVLPLVAHMRLIEEVEGKRPPYGVLLMGPEGRTVKIKNTEEKQRWLQTQIDEMRSIIDGVPAVPAPGYYKCKSCDVREFCPVSAYRPDVEPGLREPSPKNEEPDE